MKTRRNSYKPKNEIGQKCICFMSIIKSPRNFIMRVHIKDSKFVIITELKTFYFDLPQDVDNNVKHEIDSVIKHNEFLAEHTIANKIS